MHRIPMQVCLLILLCFLWTGAAYITWLYRLTDLFGSFRADWLSEVVGYLVQAVGLLLLAMAVKRKPDLCSSSHTLTVAVLADGFFMSIAILANTAAAVLIFGLLMNLFHGVIAGIYLTKLAQYVPQQKKGVIFGVAYGLGSIGTWLLSLPMDHGFLQSNRCLIVFFCLAGLILLLNYAGRAQKPADDADRSSGFQHPNFPLIALVIFLLSAVKGLGFYFPTSESLGGTISLEFSRAFYAIGLIAAGVIGDKNRKYGAICCLAALVFPFISLACNDVPNASTAIWILGYVFFGFFSVYRVVVFSDIAAKKNSLLWMAGFGLMFGRIGDAAGTVCGIVMQQHKALLICFTGICFIATVFLFFAFYHRLYIPTLTQAQNEEKNLAEFKSQFALSAREGEVFQLIIKGRSNAEIAADLYISESTVKFHVKNVLRKTDCKNRTELSLKFKQL